MNCKRGIELYEKAKRIIPGGTQLLSKRPELFLPDLWPSYYKKCSGAEVVDLDGNTFIDMSINGVGACILGYADPDVDNAVKEAITNGSMSTLNCPEEIELAELMLDIHPWADMVRYARCGGEAMTLAVRIARASSRKDLIVFCGYHGWHDWYLSANLSDDSNLDGQLLPGLNPAGVPRALAGSSIPFLYNRPETLDAIVSEHGDRIAAIVMEPVRHDEPEEGFLAHVRKTADKLGVVLIFDEVTSAWRLNTGGVHLVLGVEPDIAVFAKGISNGYPMAAVIGKRSVMEAAQETFISSTYWTERIGPVAAIATIKKMKEHNVPAHLGKIGQSVRNIWTQYAVKYGLNIKVHGIPPLSIFVFDYGEQTPLLHTIFTQEMLELGFLASKAFYATYAHREDHLAKYEAAIDTVFGMISLIIQQGRAEDSLKGPVAHSGFKRLA
ncbi:MAG: aminotransferase class III-fold pyridoxal phosphate-dependent enzyme [Nitrospira sp.]|nr:aminotransferase class III-fold pyridoxal phosphate-dependent enzyme [bacterium]MBL7050078.1 aminotransferase class III-fold pyridoxal phosphate-dependent enzyme [Nitrospira sp.]